MKKYFYNRKVKYMPKVNNFTNTTFLVLSYLYDHRLKNNLVVATQGEIAIALGYSRPTINRILTNLCQLGCVQTDGEHLGRYIVSSSGIKVVETIRKVENI